MRTDQNIVNHIAGMLTDDPEIFEDAEGALGGGGGEEDEYEDTGAWRKKRHPLGAPPPYPGSDKDKAAKARQAKVDKQRRDEKLNRSGNPFGDSLLHDVDGMITG